MYVFSLLIKQPSYLKISIRLISTLALAAAKHYMAVVTPKVKADRQAENCKK